MNRLLFLVSLLFSVSAYADSPTTFEALHTELITVAAGSVTSSYVEATANQNPVKFLDIVNGANCTIVVSFDGATDHFILLEYTALFVPYGTAGKHVSQNIDIKYSGSACSSGNVYFSLVY